jgi:hypothetical protein
MTINCGGIWNEVILGNQLSTKIFEIELKNNNTDVKIVK